MKKLLAAILIFLLIGPVIHAEFMVQKALYSIGGSPLTLEAGNLDQAVESELIGILYQYHVRAFYTREEITLLVQIAVLERVVREQCDADAPEYEPVSCSYFDNVLADLNEAHFWAEGVRPNIRRLWWDKFGTNLP